MENLEAMAVIVGLVNGFRLLKDAQTMGYWGFAFFGMAVLTGVILGSLSMFGLNVETGIIVALASSGFYRVGEKIGGN